MDKAARIRWACLLSILAVCIAAALYPMAEPETGSAVVNTTIRATSAPEASARQEQVLAAETAVARADPFAPRGWNPPPPPPPPAPASAPAVMQTVAPAGPPPLPFQFVGRMNDGGAQTVYLLRGEQTIVARSGEMLDAAYKVLGIEGQRIDFEYTPTGAIQSLTLPGQDN